MPHYGAHSYSCRWLSRGKLEVIQFTRVALLMTVLEKSKKLPQHSLRQIGQEAGIEGGQADHLQLSPGQPSTTTAANP